MAINETIVTGRKFRKCIDAVNKTWQRISFWTKSSDVEFEDGKNAETKLGAIDGITDSLVDTSSRMAASAKAVSTLNNNLTNIEQSFRDGCDRIMAAVTARGVTPTSNSVDDIVLAINAIQTDVAHTVYATVSISSPNDTHYLNAVLRLYSDGKVVKTASTPIYLGGEMITISTVNLNSGTVSI